MFAQLRSVLLPANTQFTSGEAVTLGFTYFTVGLTVAVLHVTDGAAPWVMIASIFLVNSVTPTLAYAAVTAAGGSTVAGVLSGWLVATRFGLFAAAIPLRNMFNATIDGGNDVNIYQFEGAPVRTMSKEPFIFGFKLILYGAQDGFIRLQFG